MQKIITKSLTSLALAGAVALPFVASSVHGRSNTSIDSQNPNSLDNSTLIAGRGPGDPMTQDGRDCKYEKNTDLKAYVYIASCMNSVNLDKIDQIDKQYISQRRYADVPLRNMTLRWIKTYKTAPYVKAYGVLTNKSNLRDPKDVPYMYETNRPEKF